MEYGGLEGLSLADDATLRELRALWQCWRTDPAAPCPGGGESVAELARRGGGALRSIVAAEQASLVETPAELDEKRPGLVRHVAVVAHSMPVSAKSVAP